uniref:Uncharacterized protein n=1 Tax=Glossina palpalis gambiensis TaxID=67801 RepID=A0A1B0BWN3_9MUSC
MCCTFEEYRNVLNISLPSCWSAYTQILKTGTLTGNGWGTLIGIYFTTVYGTFFSTGTGTCFSTGYGITRSTVYESPPPPPLDEGPECDSTELT